MNPIPDMEKPSGQSEAYDLTYFDGHKRRVYVTDDQFYLTNTMMIFSRTDTKGFITSVNLPFIEASGWEKKSSSASRTTSCATRTCRHPPLKICGARCKRANNGRAA